MNKKILTLCAIASIAVAVFSCSKKDDDKAPETTTSTTSTTTTPTKPAKKYPTPGSQQLAIDTTLFDYLIPSCINIDQGRYAMSGNMVGVLANKFTATWGKSPNFATDFIVTPELPPISNGTMIQLKATLAGVDFIAQTQTGKVSFFKNPDSSGIKFTKLLFKGSNDSLVRMSGFLQCP